jgi:predicted phage terminase large subunit-like protein
VTVIQPGAGVQERVRREKARRHFMDFCGYVDKKYPVDAPHLKLLADKLEGVAEYVLSGGVSGIPRLMVFMPPRYWKSNTCSQKFPAWLLGKDPEKRVILASYGADLATEHSGKVRDLIDGEKYKNIFGARSSLETPVEISADRHSAQAWALENHSGGMISAGVGGAIVGKGGHLLVLDDPFKNREEAESETNRRKVVKWYKSSFYTRQEDNAAIVIIMTRWDQEDIAGALLADSVGDEDADQWDVVFLPALALEPADYPQTAEQYHENLLRGTFIPMHGDQLGRVAGQPLWPEKHDEAKLKSIAANIDDFEFISQYQQMPRLAIGGFLDDNDFQYVDRAPDGARWYAYMDLALGERETSDFNVTGGVALVGENLYIRDVLQERELEAFLPEVRALMLGEKERGTVWGVEDVAFQKLVFTNFARDAGLVRVEIMPIKPRGDKVERARAWRRRAKNKQVFLVRGQWNKTFIRQAASFPTGRHDDMVDFVSGSVQMMADAQRAEPSLLAYARKQQEIQTALLNSQVING